MDAALRPFGTHLQAARRALLRRLSADSAANGTLESSSSGALVLTSSDQSGIPACGVKSIVAPSHQLAEVPGGRQLRRKVWQAQGGSLDNLVRIVCVRLGASPELVASGGRCRPEAAARAVISHVACDALGEPMATIARTTGTTRQAIRRCRSRGSAILGRLGLAAEVLILESSR
ncbi:MAG: hypothetical protein MUE73_18990 [Planctomycetes bacterium]|nr:hypothetical protein [Planctomycetota bacterium]